MSDGTRLMAYGENAATFFIFGALAASPRAVERVLLAHLKSFGTGRENKSWPEFEDIGVWLFPNFGKSTGFGEPDAVVLARDTRSKEEYAFWVEVETTIKSRTRLSSLQQSLVQMRRFNELQRAIDSGVKNESGFRRIIGETLRNSGEIRAAMLKVAGHGVLQKILKRLRAVGSAANDHYVLFTVNKPSGEGKGGLGYAKVLSREVASLFGEHSGTPKEMPLERCWYAYWKGDLERKFNEGRTEPFNLGDTYVRIRR
jgi:hypothetical protein